MRTYRNVALEDSFSGVRKKIQLRSASRLGSACAYFAPFLCLRQVHPSWRVADDERSGQVRWVRLVIEGGRVSVNDEGLPGLRGLSAARRARVIRLGAPGSRKYFANN